MATGRPGPVGHAQCHVTQTKRVLFSLLPFIEKKSFSLFVFSISCGRDVVLSCVSRENELCGQWTVIENVHFRLASQLTCFVANVR